MTFNKSEKQERQYLKQILDIIRNAIGNTESAVKERVQTLNEQKRYLWDNKDIDPHEIKQVRENILNVFAIGENVIAKKERLVRMLDIPYFGRIDFKENKKDSPMLPIYIGVHSFYDSDTHTNLIYDWRAPVSSMYYDFEPGEATYESRMGEVSGYISLKRQYRIREGRMEYMLDSSITVHDDVLQKELSANTDDKMKSIITTIQREQNLIIRDDQARVLIIQGVAGSGKTSIALHRVAWLLYTHKDTLSSKDILIISPSRVFADYISNVLPELGEETVPQSGMAELLSEVLERKYKYQTFFEQVTELLEKPDSQFIKRIEYKSSLEFVSLLDSFLLHVENNFFRAVDLKIQHITIPHEFILQLFMRFHRMAMRARFEMMGNFIAEELQVKYHIAVTTRERNFLKKEIRGMFAGNNDLELYKEFFQWAGHPEMFRIRKNRTLEYCDLAPLAYLRIALDGIKPNTKVKHLLIDEMQDYSPIQYKVMQKLFPSRKTILGDAGQSVNPYGSSTGDMIQKTFANSKIMKLNKSYRSTYEITRLAQNIRINEELETVPRHGENPQTLKFSDSRAEISAIIELISVFRESEYKSLGIVCKTETQGTQLAEILKESDSDIFYLSSQSSSFTNGIVVTSAHMAKGLEFDEVIIPHATADNYCSEIDRNMLYVGVTRAMHKLTLTCAGKFTDLIN